MDGELKAHLLRSAGTDLNMPLALALISFVFVEYWGFRAHGFGYLKKFFALGNLFRLRPSGLINAYGDSGRDVFGCLRADCLQKEQIHAR